MTEYRDFQKRLAERARHATHTSYEAHGRRPWPAHQTAWVMCALVVIGAGFFLLMHFGELFVFHYAEPYRNIVMLLTVLLAPIVCYRLGQSLFDDELSKRHPTAWIRKGILLPLTAIVVVVFPLTAPLGWLFAGVAWLDGATQQVPATAIEVQPYSSRKGCDQFATLRLLSVEKETCLDYLYPRSAMRRGQPLTVIVRTVPFGFLIVSIADTDQSEQD